MGNAEYMGSIDTISVELITLVTLQRVKC